MNLHIQKKQTLLYASNSY